MTMTSCVYHNDNDLKSNGDIGNDHKKLAMVGLLH